MRDGRWRGESDLAVAVGAPGTGRVSLFLSGPGVRTLPIDMIAYMEINYDPSVAALSALLAFMSVAIVFAVSASVYVLSVRSLRNS